MRSSLRRAFAIVCYWDDDTFIVENYLARRAAQLPPALLQLLPDAVTFTPRDELASRLSRSGVDSDDVIGRLLDCAVLVEENSAVEHLDRRVAEGWRWGHDARWFHFSSADVRYLVEPDDQIRALTEQAQGSPPPPPERPARGDVLPLPGSFDDRGDGLWSTLYSRRTRREFTRQPVDLDTLSRLVLWTWGATDRRSHPVLGTYLLKTSPSGGARHPMDMYLLAHRVTGLAPGVYRYRPLEHALEDLEIAVDADLLQDVFAGHAWFREAAAAFVMTAVIERNAWKYRHSHAYRVLLLDAGHVGQTFHLVCTELGLAPFTTAAIDDVAATSLLSLDPADEIVVYGAATGFPALRADYGRRDAGTPDRVTDVDDIRPLEI